MNKRCSLPCLCWAPMVVILLSLLGFSACDTNLKVSSTPDQIAYLSISDVLEIQHKSGDGSKAAPYSFEVSNRSNAPSIGFQFASFISAKDQNSLTCIHLPTGISLANSHPQLQGRRLTFDPKQIQQGASFQFQCSIAAKFTNDSEELRTIYFDGSLKWQNRPPSITLDPSKTAPLPEGTGTKDAPYRIVLQKGKDSFDAWLVLEDLDLDPVTYHCEQAPAWVVQKTDEPRLILTPDGSIVPASYPFECTASDGTTSSLTGLFFDIIVKAPPPLVPAAGVSLLLPPPEPSGFSSSSTTDSILLTWTASSGSTVGYEIAYRPGQTPPASCTSDHIVHKDTVDQTSHRITGLTPGATYSFRLCTRNANNVQSAGVTLTESTQNHTPTITTIQSSDFGTIDMGTSSGTIHFNISDADEVLSCQDNVSASSSDQNVIPNGNIVITGGNSESCSITVRSQAGQHGGPITITVTVEDSGTVEGSVSTTYQVTVRPYYTIGQTSLAGNIKMEIGLSYPGRMTIAAGKLIMPDSNNNRVMIWNQIPSTTAQPADVILGQPHINSTSINTGGISGATMNWPTGVYSDGTKLYVTDNSNHRILVWNTIPTSLGTPADFALGQPDLTSNTANNGGRSASTLRNPEAIHSDGQRLFVTDAGNARVLIWDTIPTTFGAPADHVLGQPNFTSSTQNNGGISASSLKYPTGILSVGQKLIVTETNNRALIWNTIPTASTVPADVVLGQADFTTNTINAGGRSAKSLDYPESIWSDGTKLAIADYNNNRVLVWNTIPTVSHTAADLVLGQPNFTTAACSTSSITAAKMCGTYGIASGDGKFFVSECFTRILGWNSFPTSDGQPADFVLGQLGFTTDDINLDPNPVTDGRVLNWFEDASTDGTRLFVAEWDSSRVLVWNTLPTSSGVPADFALGQPSLATRTINNGGLSASSLYQPTGVFSDGTHLVVADRYNHRVLIWNTMPTSFAEPANVVLGQANFTSSTCNSGGVSASSLCSPSKVLIASGKLYVADYDNHRVLVWNTIPTVSNTPANYALGQPDLVSNAANNGGISGSTMANPYGLGIDASSLYVADTGNNRVLVWNTIPSTSGQSASLALGQPDLNSNSANNGGISASTLNWPTGVASNGTHIAVSDQSNSRILIWDTAPSSSGEPANQVLGQPTFTSSAINALDPLDTPVYVYPVAVFWNQGTLFIGDGNNYRIVARPYP